MDIAKRGPLLVREHFQVVVSCVGKPNCVKNSLEGSVVDTKRQR